MAAGVPEFLVAWAASQSDLTDLIGDRVSPYESARGDARPRVTFYQVTGDRVQGLMGPLGVARQRWQLNCYGTTFKQARDVARLITGWAGESRLDGYSGSLGGITVKSCTLLDERDDSEQSIAGDKSVPCVGLDFDIAWQTV